ncbi:hypothetical protein AAG906_015527 [Vitis piasezkii]
MSQMDEFEHFIMGRTQNNTEHEDGLSCGEMETNSAAAVMKEVMGRAEAKFGHGEGVVQRAQDEAHERAATEANERAERAAADARKKASVQAKEKEAWAKALVEKNRWDFQTLREQAERHGSWLALILDIEAPPLPLMKWSGFQVGLQHSLS